MAGFVSANFLVMRTPRRKMLISKSKSSKLATGEKCTQNAARLQKQTVHNSPVHDSKSYNRDISHFTDHTLHHLKYREKYHLALGSHVNVIIFI
jgi:hypothetical protein